MLVTLPSCSTYKISYYFTWLPVQDAGEDEIVFVFGLPHTKLISLIPWA